MKNRILGLWNMGEDLFHPLLSPFEGKKIIKEAIKAGIKSFDSAFSYKNADNILASALKDLNIDRKEVKIISKVMPVPTLEKKVDTSLRRLNTAYIDQLLLHWPTDELSLYSSLKKLETIKDRGKAVEIGVSNFPIALLKKVILDFQITVHERPLSLIWNKDYQQEKSLGIKIYTYSPLAMGVLCKASEELKDNRKNLYIFKEGINEYKILSKKIEEICIRDGISKATLAFAWVDMNTPDGIIFGVSKPEQIKTDEYKLSIEDFSILNKLADEVTAKAPDDNIFSHKYLI